MRRPASHARAALSLGIVGLFLAGAGTTQRAAREPTGPKTQVDVETLSPLPERCLRERPFAVVKGPVPAGAVPLVSLALRADGPLSFDEVEALLAERAHQACADGVSLLRAVADEQARGVLEARAIAWRHPAPAGDAPAH